MPVITFSDPKSLFIACSVKMDMGPLNIVPLSVGTCLALTVEGTGETWQEEFPFTHSVGSLSTGGFSRVRPLSFVSQSLV